MCHLDSKSSRLLSQVGMASDFNYLAMQLVLTENAHVTYWRYETAGLMCSDNQIIHN